MADKQKKILERKAETAGKCLKNLGQKITWHLRLEKQKILDIHKDNCLLLCKDEAFTNWIVEITKSPLVS
ncbi:hypothetical protein [Nostoc sp. NZL]|uniref:hypothetical protein n=1 Tax=Nostoc sp. NZL TaxID=2650612 RepID=UPI0018C7EDDE|nr:hypothetical protein [Nostoc sp. NZL]MBG1243162.1 hypothetical protein [Nostoc sp. NZL]